MSLDQLAEARNLSDRQTWVQPQFRHILAGAAEAGATDGVDAGDLS